MKISLIEGLPFISLTINYRKRQLKLNNILIDTGSGGTVLPVDTVSSINMLPEPDDELHCIRGVGGVEYIFEKQVDFIEVGGLKIENFTVEIGQVDYGFNIQGILGVNFLIKTGAVIDLGKLTLE